MKLVLVKVTYDYAALRVYNSFQDHRFVKLTSQEIFFETGKEILANWSYRYNFETQLRSDNARQ